MNGRVAATVASSVGTIKICQMIRTIDTGTNWIFLVSVTTKYSYTAGVVVVVLVAFCFCFLFSYYSESLKIARRILVCLCIVCIDFVLRQMIKHKVRMEIEKQQIPNGFRFTSDSSLLFYYCWNHLFIYVRLSVVFATMTTVHRTPTIHNNSWNNYSL